MMCSHIWIPASVLLCGSCPASWLSGACCPASWQVAAAVLQSFSAGMVLSGSFSAGWQSDERRAARWQGFAAVLCSFALTVQELLLIDAYCAQQDKCILQSVLDCVQCMLAVCVLTVTSTWCDTVHGTGPAEARSIPAT
jgi:hypothetical protein